MSSINPGVITAKMSWDALPPEIRAAAYLAVTFQEKPPYVVPTYNIAFEPCCGLGLISKEGIMHEITRQGLLCSLHEL